MPYTGASTLFKNLIATIQLQPGQIEDATGKHQRVRAALNKHYYNIDSKTANSMLVGSYGKNTAIRPPSDIDILFTLPYSVYERYKQRTGNIQSQLLQEVRDVLLQRFPSTAIKADGQIISVPFTTFAVEVLPTFLLTSGKYWHADTNNGGKWRLTDPDAEQAALTASNTATGGKTIHLIKLAKAWKRSRNAHIKSIVLELVATSFLAAWQYRDKTGYEWYTWMVRDFFPYLLKYKNSKITLPGTGDHVYAGEDWVAQAEFARNAAARALAHSAADRADAAKAEWQKMFSSYL